MENFIVQRGSEIFHSCLRIPQLGLLQSSGQEPKVPGQVFFCYTELEAINPSLKIIHSFHFRKEFLCVCV